MRQIYCKNYSYYKFLEDLKDLPDSCITTPYYDSEFTQFNVFYTFCRHNSDSVDGEVYFDFCVNKKELNHRISYSRTQMLFKRKIMESEFYPLLFVSSLNKLDDYIKYLISLDSDLSNLLDELWSSQSCA